MEQKFPYIHYRSKVAAQRLTELQTFTASLLEGIGDGVIVVDREYKIISANQKYCDQVQVTVDDLIGKPCYKVSHQIDTPCFERGDGCDCAVRKCYQTGEHHRALHEHHDKDGHTLYIETNAYPLKNPSGTVISAIETLHD